MKPRTQTKLLTAVMTGAMVFAASSTHAAITVDGNRIKQDYPLKSTDPLVNTMENWLVNNPTAYALNPINVRGGFHPDRSDPDEKGGDYDVLYIFPDAATADAWWDPTVDATPPIEIPDTAVAMIHWELDNGSGSFPGVMSKSDIDGFKSRNCIMAAGDVIPVPDPNDPNATIEVEKTCSNPQGSSKRFKMNVLISDAPIDLVYNVEPLPLTYTNYDTLPTFDGVEESGRVYRSLQKWHNTTAMDSATQTRDGVRIAGFSMALGHGVGSAFAPIESADGTGLEVDKVLGFELRPCMPDHFLDVFRPNRPPGSGQNPCSGTVDSTGQELPQEIWLEEEYGTFSPAMYSFVGDKRRPLGGFWDKRPAGVYPPAIQSLGLLDSGVAASDDPVYWDSRVDGATALPGYVGATTPNYFDIIATQATEVGATTVDDVPLPNPFGYLMYWGVLADGDVGILPWGIYADDDGIPATEGGLIAWWDGAQYRWGIDGSVFDGVVNPDDAFAPVDPALLAEWAENPLVEEPDFVLYPDTGFPPGPLYETGVTDDLAGLNVDYFVYLGRNYDAAANPTFTIRMTTVSVNAAGVQPNDYGNEEPAWVANPAPPLEDFLNGGGTTDEVDVAIDELEVDFSVEVNKMEELKVKITNYGPDAASGTVSVIGTDSAGEVVASINAEFTDLAADTESELKFSWMTPSYPTVIEWVAEVTAEGDTNLNNNAATATTRVVE
ncbi:MAG: choice-of-anchor F family protein [Gammaproteobacteria bacterium]|nr:choice-of-anchor F family protein [Gammaproteobacteria bacterium]